MEKKEHIKQIQIEFKEIFSVDKELGNVNLIKQEFHGDWNYIIKPQKV